jgi:hypothetical protein
MTLAQFAALCSLDSLPELEKVCHIAFFHLKTAAIEEFSTSDAVSWLVTSGYSNPNKTRLEGNIKSSRNTLRAPKGFRLTVAYVKSLETKYPTVSAVSQDVIDDGTILPEIDYKDTRGYIESLAKQLNLSYEKNIFDGCAVLMRRLLEIMLILSYKHLHIESEIQNGDGSFMMLEGIINSAKTNATLALSRNSKSSLEVFRQLGNFSAHKIEYTCRREYIQPHVQEYRAMFVELLYKAGIRK